MHSKGVTRPLFVRVHSKGVTTVVDRQSTSAPPNGHEALIPWDFKSNELVRVDSTAGARRWRVSAHSKELAARFVRPGPVFARRGGRWSPPESRNRRWCSGRADMLGNLYLSTSMLIFPLACPAEGRYICRPEESAFIPTLCKSQADSSLREESTATSETKKMCKCPGGGCDSGYHKGEINDWIFCAYCAFSSHEKRAFEEIDPGGSAKMPPSPRRGRAP